jgi:hypothetical protein
LAENKSAYDPLSAHGKGILSHTQAADMAWKTFVHYWWVLAREISLPWWKALFLGLVFSVQKVSII